MPRNNDRATATLEERAAHIAELIDDQKGENIVVLDLRGVCGFADAFVIATVRSSTHMQSLVTRLVNQLREEGVRPLMKPDPAALHWALLDYGDVIVHLFDGEGRDYYDLETLWGDGAPINWSPATLA
ncbi:MAG: ribosome silencing factor [bacterium]|nr:ribosome silencing factor [bacterium]